MDLNLYRNKRGFIELDKLNPEKLEDGKIFGKRGLMLLKFSDGNEILFKRVFGEVYFKLYSALVVEEITKQLGLPHAEYDMGVYENYCGFISWDFLEKDEVLILGSEILTSVNKKHKKNYENNLKDISEALKLYIHDEGVTQKLIEDLTINHYMFDVAIASEDRHSKNWGIIFNSNESNYRCANIFDTDYLARTDYGKGVIGGMLKRATLPDRSVDINEIKKHSKYSKQKLLYDSRNLLLPYDFYLFCRANIDLAKKGFGIISKIDIKSAFEAVEAKIGIKLPEEYKVWLEIMVNYRINLMKETIYNAEMLKFATEEGNAPRI